MSDKVCAIIWFMGNQRAKGGFTLMILTVRGLTSDRKKGALPMYVTYSDLIQSGIFIVALVGLCYTVFRERK